MNVQHFCFYLLHCLLLAGYCTPVILEQKITFGRKLDENIVNTLIEVSLNSCFTECNRRNHCGSINYHRLMKLCELNFRTTEDKVNLTVAPGYVFKRKEADHLDQCDNKCKHGEVCSDDRKCEIRDCLGLHVNNGIALGNMKKVGSKAIVKCNSGYEIEHRDRRAECERFGKWTNGNEITCKKVCEAPENIEGGVLTEAEIFAPTGVHFYSESKITDMLKETILDGSSVKYKCQDSLQMYGPGSSTCKDGNWSSPPVCFNSPCRSKKNDFCLKHTLTCSNMSCYCEIEVGNFSIQLCIESCSDESKITLGNNITTNEAVQNDMNDVYFTDMPHSRCEQICQRTQDFACESIKPRFDFDFNNMGNATCVKVTSFFRNPSTEIWWDDSGCSLRAKLFS